MRTNMPKKVSILIQLEVGWEELFRSQFVVSPSSFNPYSVGSRLGRALSEVFGEIQKKFQSLFSWK